MRIVKSNSCGGSYFLVEVSVNGAIKSYALSNQRDVERLLSGEVVLDTHNIEVIIPATNFTVIHIVEITKYDEVCE